MRQAVRAVSFTCLTMTGSITVIFRLTRTRCATFSVGGQRRALTTDFTTNIKAYISKYKQSRGAFFAFSAFF